VLPGFGVEAVLKNMEYSAVDDKAKEAAKQAKGSGDEPLGAAKGFDFDQLVKRKPHLKQELLTFKDALTTTDDGEALKVRQQYGVPHTNVLPAGLACLGACSLATGWHTYGHRPPCRPQQWQ
jgi:hypothetical protein